MITRSIANRVKSNTDIIVTQLQNDLNTLHAGEKLEKHWNRVYVIDAQTNEKKVDRDLPRAQIKERQQMGVIKNKDILKILDKLPSQMEFFAMEAEAIYKRNKACVTVVIENEVNAAVKEFAMTPLGSYVNHLQKAQAIHNEGSYYYDSEEAYTKHLKSEVALADQALHKLDEKDLKKAEILTKVHLGDDKVKMSFILFSETKFIDKMESKLKSQLNVDPNAIDQYRRPSR
jgi:hypothetical protein